MRVKAFYSALCILLVILLFNSCSPSEKPPADSPSEKPSAASSTQAADKSFESVIYEIKNGSAIITGCVKNITDRLIIPDKIDGFPVTAIADFAFKDEIKLTGVKIPESVTDIGEGAFFGCTGIRNIDIPDTVENIGHNAFYNTAYYNFKTSWDGKVLYAGNHLIYAKRSIDGEYTVREGTCTVADNAFSDTEGGYCSELKKISFPSSVKFIGKSAFEYCEGLTEINIPEGVLKIGAAAFRECTGLKDISLPDSVRNIGENAFIYTAFYNNSNNRENGVMYIGRHLIKAEDSVSGSYTVRPGTLSIADSAFSYCLQLNEIIIPETVTFAGKNIFTGCDNLGNILYEGGEKEWDSVFSGSTIPSAAVIQFDYGKNEYSNVSTLPASPDEVTGEYIAADAASESEPLEAATPS